MNNRFLGNAPCLTKYDLLMEVVKGFQLSAWYVTMLTEPTQRNKGDRNATNYRIGSKNADLFALMKTLFYGDDTSINEVYDFIKQKKITLNAVTARNNQKAGHYRLGSITHYSNKDRDAYFTSLVELIDKKTNQLIFIDPDTGIIPSSHKLNGSKASAFITSLEAKFILDALNDKSIVMVQQSLTNYLYPHEARVRDLQSQLQPNVVLLVDEVIQSGVYFFTKNDAVQKKLSEFLWEYLKSYQFVKSNERIMMLIGNSEGITIKPLGVSSSKA